MARLEDFLKNSVKGKEQLLPSTIQKWNPCKHRFDQKSVLDVVIFK